MAWKATHVMDHKGECALRAVRRVEPFKQLCEEVRISRRTGYKWKERCLRRDLGGIRPG